MMWKCTCAMAWWALLPLFSSTLYSFTPVAATTARHSRGSTRPTAAADSSDSPSSVSAGSFGTTSVCPSDNGLMSRKARTCSSSYTLLQGISPRTILPNIVSAMGESSYGLTACRSFSLRRVASRQALYEFDCETRKLDDSLCASDSGTGNWHEDQGCHCVRGRQATRSGDRRARWTEGGRSPGGDPRERRMPYG